MNAKVLLAVFKRNFFSYFASPLGYLFICLYVVMCVSAAFWTNNFFAQNLANLDTLNAVYPFIMLLFIPAITMGIWADERRQGTDELLLTIPASDLDIVLGKYLAGVGIYTMSLLYSLVCNLIVLKTLGRPDLGLFLTTYFGYWLIGITMLAIGLVASFLTSNLTVAYLLGAAFNAPLVFLYFADTIFPRSLAPAIKDWSVGAKFQDFGRGVVCLSGMAYFLSITLAMLYLSMVLIARRHWVRGKDWFVMAAHYGVRVAAIIVFAVGVNVLFHRHDFRKDASQEGLSSLATATRELISSLKADDTKKPVLVEAFVSPTVPEWYIQTRLNLLLTLEELQAEGGEKVQVRINRTELHSEEAARAEKRYGIAPRRLVVPTSGTPSPDQVFLAVAVSSGLRKVVIPFVDRGTPIEYELVRSIMTVSDQKRKKIGVLQTDAQLFGGGMNMMMGGRGDWPIIEELQKTYDVASVDASQPITETYDVLLAVQPSTLTPEQMTNFVAAVRSGQATAIFEDPCPFFARNVPATSMPRTPPRNPMMGMMPQQQQLPKGDIGQLWAALGVNFAKDEVLYQAYNPYPKLADLLVKEFVFVNRGMDGVKDPFNDDNEITSGLQQVLLPFPGALSKLPGSKLEFTTLLKTGDQAGYVRYQDLMQPNPFGGGGGLNEDREAEYQPGGGPMILAARIKGDLPPSQPMADEKTAAAPAPGADTPAAGGAKALPPDLAELMKAAGKTPPDASPAKPATPPKPGKINVVVVCDIDFLHEAFFRLREQPEFPEQGIRLEFDNVTMVLNVLDELAGDERFVEVRKRRREHRTLERIEALTMEQRKKTDKEEADIRKEAKEAIKTARKKLTDETEKMDKEVEKGRSATAAVQELSIAVAQEQNRLNAEIDELSRKRDRRIKQIETELAVAKRQIEFGYKMWAVLLPPIPPLFVAGLFFVWRRVQERQGVARTRLRS